jgi:hypothetical protein
MKEQLTFEELEVGRKYLSHYTKSQNIKAGDWPFIVNSVEKTTRTARVTFLKPDKEKAVFACSVDGAWTHHGRLRQNVPISVWALDSQNI